MKTFLATVSAWSRPQKVVFLTAVGPILACLVTMGVLALIWRASYLFTDYSTSIPIMLLSALGSGLGISLRRYLFLAWLPTALLFFVQFTFMARAKPPSEWIYALPSYLYTVGTPALSLVTARRLAKQIKLGRMAPAVGPPSEVGERPAGG